jgi:hypothetical protein
MLRGLNDVIKTFFTFVYMNITKFNMDPKSILAIVRKQHALVPDYVLD